MTLEYAKIVGTNTVLFETWNSLKDLSLKPVYRDTQHDGANGGYTIKLDTPPLNFQASGIILESSLANLLAMEGEVITLTAHNLAGSYTTVKIKHVNVSKGLDITSTSAANIVSTTYIKRIVALTLIRES